MPTLGFTHYQPAQLITVGRRAAQWVEELVMVLEDITFARSKLRFRGAQGTTGTQGKLNLPDLTSQIDSIQPPSWRSSKATATKSTSSMRNSVRKSDFPPATPFPPKPTPALLTCESLMLFLNLGPPSRELGLIFGTLLPRRRCRNRSRRMYAYFLIFISSNGEFRKKLNSWIPQCLWKSGDTEILLIFRDISR